ncbi:hypothetical protein B0I35DRAFT_161448 [Stachybotrys elegans]|uniref:Uncharacterized protein n=1 Tax=Stachybotrys elegans TaxID=80388 RepID=A0A8K0SX54_9HYPO|nr:hypothetical protein B0I35DRAFT_161448 [Stachybotrys elegans]
MPFDFEAYDEKCNGLTQEQLQREWNHYTRLITGAATSTTISSIAIVPTLGVSIIGVALAAPSIHNARKKREILDRHLQRLGTRHETRTRDVLGSMAFTSAINVLTLGFSTMGASQISEIGAEYAISAIIENEVATKAVTHAAFDGAGMLVEKAHTDHKKGGP